MKNRFLIFISLILMVTIFNGCTSKELSINNKSDISVDMEEEAFLDEFEEEMEVEEIYDPLSGYNRAMTDINDMLYVNILKPVAKGYRYVVHKEIRKSVSNFFHNITYPIRFINNILQLKFANSTEETGRFIINTTIGFFGFFDPATTIFKLEKHNEDFGQTLGFYGVGAGPHIVLPLFGPSNLRDMLSLYPNSLLNPTIYNEDRGMNLLNNYNETISMEIYRNVNEVSVRGKEYDNLKKDAIDLYPFLRNTYEQYREKLIKE